MAQTNLQYADEVSNTLYVIDKRTGKKGTYFPDTPLAQVVALGMTLAVKPADGDGVHVPLEDFLTDRQIDLTIVTRRPAIGK